MESVQTALAYLRTALENPHVSFRDGQWESIAQLLEGKRVLVVQRTGWGKSMVYFLAAKLLRSRGAGPTLLISPLLSLMRNQLEAAQRIGIVARSINSTNAEDWAQIQKELDANQVDLLLISPERLGNEDFRQTILANLATNIGLFAVDEAHCISDWGHDFRPDYRRIVRVLQAIPPNVPVLATTATANDRVVEDIRGQLGQDIVVQRGTLVRKSLNLQNINMPSPAARMAWLAQTVPTLLGSGIIYTLTQRDAERVARWLQKCGIDAREYHAGIDGQDTGFGEREAREKLLLNNEIKVLVATVALGMGFDKPDLGFVIHFQRPSSVVHYYQQVGRAGRAVDEAYGILLCGEEDDHIADYFIKNAFPPQSHVSEILNALEDSDGGLTVAALEGALNLRRGQIEKTLKYLTVASPSPVVKIGTAWNVTATASSYVIDETHIAAITDIRHSEQRQMREYMQHSSCLMAFLQKALDDPDSAPCGQCKNCAPQKLLSEAYNVALAQDAGVFLQQNHQILRPRKRWPAKNIFQHSPLGGSVLPQEQLAEEGRALSLWRDAGWGQLVAQGKYEDGRFSDKLVAACRAMLQDWNPAPQVQWITCIVSHTHPELVPNFAARLAVALGIPFVPCIKKARVNKPQKEMKNSYQQVKNLDGVFHVTGPCPEGACLLIDDVVDSGWTFTVVTALLRQAGCSAVHPLALALNSPRAD